MFFPPPPTGWVPTPYEGRRRIEWVGRLQDVVEFPLRSEIPRPDFAAAAAAAAAYAAAAAAAAAKCDRLRSINNWLPLRQFGPILGPGGVEQPWPHQVPFPRFVPLGLVLACVGPPRGQRV